MRTSIVIASLAAATSLVVVSGVPRVAFAQISDSERQAARQLFFDGVELQKAGKYAEALDRLERAQKVIPAPTHLVRIAECQAALGRLVEAAESYRAAVRMPASGNATFTQAQEQAQAELRPLEPRIPKVKLDVAPKDVPNLSVAVDGSPINTALLDVAMPMNPGTHKITVYAPGYATDEKTITLQERDNKQLSFTLNATGAVFVDPNPPNTNPNPVYPPYRPQRPVYVRPPRQPPPEIPPQDRPAERSFLIGVRGGILVPGGNFMTRTSSSGSGSGTDATIMDVATSGGAFGIDGGIRLGRLYLGLTYEFASFGRGNNYATSITGDTQAQRALPTQNVTVQTNSHYFGLDLGYISNPTGLGVYADIGVGYRVVPHTLRVEDAVDTSRFWEMDETLSGGDFKLALGIHIAAGPIRIIPKVTVGIGSFSNLSTKCDVNGLPAFSCGSNLPQSIDQNSTHSFIFAGVGAYYDREIR